MTSNFNDHCPLSLGNNFRVSQNQGENVNELLLKTNLGIICVNTGEKAKMISKKCTQ